LIVPALSVLLPCYNAAETLDEALDSLTKQTFSDFEIIAVDDGSQDNTKVILQRWAQSDRRVQILSQPHGGIVAALNAGLTYCQAPYIARMDADDRIHPNRFQLQLQYLEEHPEIAVVGCQVQGFPKENVQRGFADYLDWLNSLQSSNDFQREIFIESPLAHPGVMFRRTRVEQAGGYQDHGWAEDYDLWLRLYLQGEHFASLPQVLLQWRQHPGRLTFLDDRYSLANFQRAKSFYLVRGPLRGRDAVLVWGAGLTGRRFCRQLLLDQAPVVSFFDVDEHKIGRRYHGLPVGAPEMLPVWWQRYAHPILLVAVGARGARPYLRTRLNPLGLTEGIDWWFVA
jgi:glycosyltransferase involved in cell wall biosynthesis